VHQCSCVEYLRFGLLTILILELGSKRRLRIHLFLLLIVIRRVVNVINVIARETRSIDRLGLLTRSIDLIPLSLRLILRIASHHRWNNDKKPVTIPTSLVNVATGLLVHNPRIPCE
jgi:uncharacterized membrane protein YecN with MAPEG domain